MIPANRNSELESFNLGCLILTCLIHVFLCFIKTGACTCNIHVHVLTGAYTLNECVHVHYCNHCIGLSVDNNCN